MRIIIIKKREVENIFIRLHNKVSIIKGLQNEPLSIASLIEIASRKGKKTHKDRSPKEHECHEREFYLQQRVLDFFSARRFQSNSTLNRINSHTLNFDFLPHSKD